MNQWTVSLWRDEAFSVFMAQKNILDIITTTAKDTSPPLYYIILHFWIQIFGTSEIAIRSLSVFLFVLIGITIFFFTKELFGKKAAYFAAVLTLCNPFLFSYAFEARMYMLVVLFTTLSMWFFSTKRYVFYVIATVLALFTHHFAIFIFITQVVYYIGVTIKESFFGERISLTSFIKKQYYSPYVRSIMSIAFLYCFWLPFFVQQNSRVTDSFWITKPNVKDFGDLYKTFLISWPNFFFSQWIYWISIILLVLRGFRKRTDVILYCWLFLPPIITFILAQFTRPIFYDRYLMVSIPAMPMLLASQLQGFLSLTIISKNTVVSFLRKIQLTDIVLSLMLVGLVMINIHIFTNPGKEPFRELANYIKANYKNETPIINYYIEFLHYLELKYYGVNAKVYSPDNTLPFWSGAVLVDPKDIMIDFPKTNILYVMASGSIEQIRVPGYKETKRIRFNNLYLFEFEKKG